MDTRTECYVREQLLLDAQRIFSCAGFKPKHIHLEDFQPVAIYHRWLNFWELGFIPTVDKRETKDAFVYSATSNSLFGPFWCFFQNGRWELYLAND